MQRLRLKGPRLEGDEPLGGQLLQRVLRLSWRAVAPTKTIGSAANCRRSIAREPKPRVPIWIALHAELEVDHSLDALRPILAERAPGTASLAAVHSAVGQAFGRHAEYLDTLLEEHVHRG